MTSEIGKETARPRKTLQSVAALFAGFVVNVALSLGTDLGLHAELGLQVPPNGKLKEVSLNWRVLCLRIADR